MERFTFSCPKTCAALLSIGFLLAGSVQANGWSHSQIEAFKRAAHEINAVHNQMRQKAMQQDYEQARQMNQAFDQKRQEIIRDHGLKLEQFRRMSAQAAQGQLCYPGKKECPAQKE